MKSHLFFSVYFLAIVLLPSGIYGQSIISSFAGLPLPCGYSGDGIPATASKLYNPYSLLAASDGSVYVSESQNRRIRKISADGIIQTIAGTGVSGYSGDGGPATNARFSFPQSMSIDIYGNLYIDDYNSMSVRKVDALTGIITTVVGNGTTTYAGDGSAATATGFSSLTGIAVDATGNIYIADDIDHVVRKIDASGIINTIAGTGVAGYSGDSGPATLARLSYPRDIAVDADGNIFITERYRIRKINTAGIISTIAGTGVGGSSGDGGPASAAQINTPYELIVDDTGTVFFADTYSRRLRKIDTFGIISTIAGTGVVGYSGDGGLATNANLGTPMSIAVSASGDIYYTDYQYCRVRRIAPDKIPYFVSGGESVLSVCRNATATVIDTLLQVVDLDAAQTLSWSLLSPPLHGAASTIFSIVSTGSTVLPVGLTYTPIAGYSGMDSFRVSVTDGYTADTITILVDVIAPPLAGTISGPSSVCVGDTVLLSHTESGGTWVSSNPSVADVVSSGIAGIAAGSVTISYSLANSCGSATATYPLNVNGLPDPIAGPSTLCIGPVSSLFSSSSPGFWSSSDPGIMVVHASAGTATGVSAGTAYITFSLPSGCFTVRPIEVITSVNPISGASGTCQESTVLLGSTTPGGLWSCSDTSIASFTLVSGAIMGHNPGTCTISYVLSAGCFTTMPFTVDALPASISGPLSICQGDTVILSSSGIGVWSGSSTAVVIDAGTGYATGIFAGTSVISYTYATGCAQAVVLTVNNLVTSGVTLSASPGTSICSASGSVTVSATAVNGGPAPGYQWLVNGVVLGSSASTLVYPPANGDIVICRLTSSLLCAIPSPAQDSLEMTVTPSVTPLVSIVAFPDDTVCIGDNILYTANGINGGTMPIYQWWLNGTMAGTGPVWGYVPSGGDIISCSLTSNAVCASPAIVNSSPSFVSVFAPATNVVNITAPTSFIVEGSPLTFAAIAPYAGSAALYQWFINSIAVYGATSSTFTTSTLQDGDIVYCKVTARVPCVFPETVLSGGFPVTVTAVDAVDILRESPPFSLYPNPTTGNLTISCMSSGISSDKIEVTIADVLGQISYRHLFSDSGRCIHENIYFPSSLGSGFYFVRLKANDEVTVFKIRLER